MFTLNELHKRILFGTIAGVIALGATLYSPLSFYALLLISALLMHSEWMDLTIDSPPLLSRLGGLVYIGLPIWSLIALYSSHSSTSVLVLFALVWTTDSCAYFTGKRFGVRRLWPRISPNKTWEGLAGGVLAAAFCGGLASFFGALALSVPYGVLLGGVIALISQAGDLFESWLKRRAGVKDSGSFIPAHGGILDRVDGLIFAAPAFLMILTLSATAP